MKYKAKCEASFTHVSLSTVADNKISQSVVPGIAKVTKTWWHTPVTPVLGGLKQGKCYQFEPSSGFIVGLCLKTTKLNVYFC